ncbi:UNVERIFIED_CONTAM: hypothetical protein FKN15_037399 [Acipenser sinensis]
MALKQRWRFVSPQTNFISAIKMHKSSQERNNGYPPAHLVNYKKVAYKLDDPVVSTEDSTNDSLQDSANRNKLTTSR